MLLAGACAINPPESLCQREASCQHSNPREATLGLLQELSVPPLQHNTEFSTKQSSSCCCLKLLNLIKSHTRSQTALGKLSTQGHLEGHHCQPARDRGGRSTRALETEMLHQTQGPLSCCALPTTLSPTAVPELQCPHQCAQKAQLLQENIAQGKQVTG